MIKVRVLTTRETPNSAAFNLPLRLHKGLLRELGLDVSLLYDSADRLFQCDVLFVNSKFFRKPGALRHQETLEFLANAKKSVERILWFDTTDSTGTAQFEVLPFVDGYYKGQVLADKHLYLKAFHGGRIFTDYYHREFGLTDDMPSRQSPRPSVESLDKIDVSWNSALGSYGRSVWPDRVRSLWGRLPVPPRRSVRFSSSGRARAVDVSCRVGFRYHRETVRFHRQKLVELLSSRHKVSNAKIPNWKYWQELRDAKVVASPFGWGEITIRDFEVMISGAALLKPNVSHMRTWPPLYVEGQTYASYSWDFADVSETIDWLLTKKNHVDVAENAQSVYRRYVSQREGHVELCQRVAKIAGQQES